MFLILIPANSDSGIAESELCITRNFTLTMQTHSLPVLGTQELLYCPIPGISGLEEMSTGFMSSISSGPAGGPAGSAAGVGGFCAETRTTMARENNSWFMIAYLDSEKKYGIICHKMIPYYKTYPKSWNVHCVDVFRWFWCYWYCLYAINTGSYWWFDAIDSMKGIESIKCIQGINVIICIEGINVIESTHSYQNVSKSLTVSKVSTFINSHQHFQDPGYYIYYKHSVAVSCG